MNHIGCIRRSSSYSSRLSNNFLYWVLSSSFLYVLGRDRQWNCSKREVQQDGCMDLQSRSLNSEVELVLFPHAIQGDSGGRLPEFGWLGFSCSTVCRFLFRKMAVWQKWLDRWARWWNIIVNPTQIGDHQSHPVVLQVDSPVLNSFQIQTHSFETRAIPTSNKVGDDVTSFRFGISTFFQSQCHVCRDYIDGYKEIIQIVT